MNFETFRIETRIRGIRGDSPAELCDGTTARQRHANRNLLLRWKVVKLIDGHNLLWKEGKIYTTTPTMRPINKMQWKTNHHGRIVPAARFGIQLSNTNGVRYANNLLVSSVSSSSSSISEGKMRPRSKSDVKESSQRNNFLHFWRESPILSLGNSLTDDANGWLITKLVPAPLPI